MLAETPATTRGLWGALYRHEVACSIVLLCASSPIILTSFQEKFSGYILIVLSYINRKIKGIPKGSFFPHTLDYNTRALEQSCALNFYALLVDLYNPPLELFLLR